MRAAAEARMPRAFAAGPERYTGVAIALHWLIALGIVAQLALGLAMTKIAMARMTEFKLYQLHKSIGITILLLVLLRVLWRLGHRPPPLPDGLPPAERVAAKGTHWMLYLFMLGLPITGWMLVSVSPYNLPTVLFGRIPWPHLPIFTDVEDKGPVEDAMKAVHAYAAWLLIAIVSVHAAAALRHHFVKRDDVLRRMLPRLSRARMPLACAVLLAAGSARAADWTIDPAASKLGFAGKQNGEAFAGKFSRFSGTVAFDPAKPEAGHADIVIDMASAGTGDTQRDEALPQAEWFNAKTFPQGHFVATGFRPKGGDAYEAAGKLSIRGISRDVTLPFTLRVSGDTAHASGHLDLVRTSYGVGQGPWSSGQWVALEVGVDLDVVAKKSGG